MRRRRHADEAPAATAFTIGAVTVAAAVSVVAAATTSAAISASPLVPISCKRAMTKARPGSSIRACAVPACIVKVRVGSRVGVRARGSVRVRVAVRVRMRVVVRVRVWVRVRIGLPPRLEPGLGSGKGLRRS